MSTVDERPVDVAPPPSPGSVPVALWRRFWRWLTSMRTALLLLSLLALAAGRLGIMGHDLAVQPAGVEQLGVGLVVVPDVGVAVPDLVADLLGPGMAVGVQQPGLHAAAALRLALRPSTVMSGTPVLSTAAGPKARSGDVTPARVNGTFPPRGWTMWLDNEVGPVRSAPPP